MLEENINCLEMADIEKAIASGDPIEVDSTEKNIPLNSITHATSPSTVTTSSITGTRAATLGRYGQQNPINESNDRKTSKGKENENGKGSLKKKHIIIITSIIFTFIGSGLVVLYSHLNEEDAREVIDTSFRHRFHKQEPTLMDKCRSETINTVKKCFNQSEYFIETVQQQKCEYLESVGICVLERKDFDFGRNCSELSNILKLILPDQTVFDLADSYLQVDIHNCSFYNETAIEEIKTKGLEAL